MRRSDLVIMLLFIVSVAVGAVSLLAIIDHQMSAVTTTITPPPIPSPSSTVTPKPVSEEGGRPISTPSEVSASSILTPTPTDPSAPSPTSTPVATPTLLPSPTDSPTPSATLTPTITPTPQPEAIIGVGGNANLRSGPGTEFDAIGILTSGQALKILGRLANSNWLKVRSLVDGREGWVARDLIQANIDLADAPVATPPATPTPTPLRVAPVLLAPEDGREVAGARPDLTWTWAGDITQSSNYYYQISIWLRDPAGSIEAALQAPPIDVALVQKPCYKYDEVPEGYEGKIWEFLWNVTVVETNNVGAEKSWSPVESCGGITSPIHFWDPGLEVATSISESSQLRSVKVLVTSPGDPGCPPGGCPTPRPPTKPTASSGGGGD